ncbi:transposable element Tc1 transposase [Trichonephila clavipes]|nr:transposable element Tc1 transposase [Trichonephila clavipes]
MPPRRNKEKFQQLTVFERWRISGLRKGGISYRAIGASLQRNSSTVMRVWNQRYASELFLPECVIEKYSNLTPGCMVSSAISYHGRSNLLRIEGNLNSNRFVPEMLHPGVVLFFQGTPGATFQQDTVQPPVAKTVRDFY